jgi:hypothetical protein
MPEVADPKHRRQLVNDYLRLSAALPPSRSIFVLAPIRGSGSLLMATLSSSRRSTCFGSHLRSASGSEGAHFPSCQSPR